MSSDVLVVEDEAALAKVLKMRLEIEGFSVRTAGDGAEAMAMIRDRHPDVIVCDLMMPVMDGFEVTRALKQDPQLKSIPLLILSARKVQKEIDQLTRLGVDGFIAKPFDSKELTNKVKHFARG